MRRTIALLGAVALLAVTAGCGEESDANLATAKPANSPEGVKLRVGVQKDGIKAILDKSGQLEDLPYEIEFSTFAFGPPLVEAAGADKIDVAGVGSTPPIFGAAAESDFRAIATLQYRNDKDDSLMVPEGSDIAKPEDLKGKTVAVAKGSSAHGLLLKVLNRVGLKPDDVTISFLQPPDALAAFTTGRVDAWSTWHPYIQQAEAEGAKAIAGGPPDEYGHSFEIASSKAVADPKRAAALKDYVARLQKAFAWAAENPDEWAKAWSEESQLPLPITKKAVRAKLIDIVPIDDETIEHQQELADRLTEDKVLPGEVRFKDIVTQGLVEGGTK